MRQEPRIGGECHTEMALERFRAGDLPNCSAIQCIRRALAEGIRLSSVSCDLLRKTAKTKLAERVGFVRLRTMCFGVISSCQRRNPAEARAAFKGARRRMAECLGRFPQLAHPCRVRLAS